MNNNKPINPKLAKKTTEVKPYTTKRWLFYMLIPTLIMLGLTVLVLKGSMYTKEESIIGYNEVGNIDYKVFLKENNYYKEQYLGKDMQYVASIIKDIVPTFTYEMHSEEKMEYTYNYKVSADLIISDPNDNNKVLYKRPSLLVKDTKEKVTGGSFRVDQDVSINYDEYNNYVNAFKKEYALSVNSKLVLTFNIDVTGKSPLLKEDFKKSSKLVIAIPMSEQTINIGIDTSDINNSGTLERNYMSQIKKPVALVLGIIVGLLSLALLYIVIYNFLTNRSKTDVYKATIKSILREYDRAIVSSKTADTIDESKYNVIEVPRIEELLDAHDSTGKPILYNEDTENDISTFIIVSDEILYKYRVVKKELEEQEEKRIAAKNKAVEEQLSKFAFLGRLFKKKTPVVVTKELDDMLSKNNEPTESTETSKEQETTTNEESTSVESEEFPVEENKEIVSTEDVQEEEPIEETITEIPEIVEEQPKINIPKVENIETYTSPINDISVMPSSNTDIEPVIIVDNVKEDEDLPKPSEAEKIIVKDEKKNVQVPTTNEAQKEKEVKTSSPKKYKKNYKFKKNNNQFYKNKRNNKGNNKNKQHNHDIEEVI
ncbi:MAG: DUF5305 family protein [Bacilli bacterium]|nr:DUF5305 family protein [bacterium]MDY2697879.1 DUF5305 family protein [Bacilli bacterium]